MTGSQYNNVVRWTLANGASDNPAGSAAAAKAVFNNCGVAFPSGSNLNILLTLLSDDYMAWRACTLKQARDYANKGIAAVGVDANRVVVITPDSSVLDRTTTLAAAASGSDTLAKSADAISPTERTSMQFFAYYALETWTTLMYLMAKFPAGYYWNRSDSSVNNQDGYTSTQCPTHANTNYCNGYDPGGGILSRQCMGFAEKCGHDATGQDPRGEYGSSSWTTSTSWSSMSNLKPGDIVRYTVSGDTRHSIYVTGMSGDTITYGDCNGTSYRCKIRWGETKSKSSLQSVFYHHRVAPYTLD